MEHRSSREWVLLGVAALLLPASAALGDAFDLYVDGLTNTYEYGALASNWVPQPVGGGWHTITLVDSDWGMTPGEENHMVCVFADAINPGSYDYWFFTLNGNGDSVTMEFYDQGNVRCGFISPSAGHGGSWVQIDESEPFWVDGVTNGAVLPDLLQDFVTVDELEERTHLLLSDSDFGDSHGAENHMVWVFSRGLAPASQDDAIFTLNGIGDERLLNAAATAGSCQLGFIVPSLDMVHGGSTVHVVTYGDIVVSPDGSGDFRTIQEAIDDAANGDEILLTDGTFTGPGNRDLDFRGKAITVRSQNGDPYACVIDCQGTADDPHRGFLFEHGETRAALVAGIGIVHGYAAGSIPNYWAGGGIHCRGGSSPTVRNCVLAHNHATTDGGGAYANESAPRFEFCTFHDNSAADAGGGFGASYCAGVELDHCTFDANAGGTGGGIRLYSSDATQLTNLIVATSSGGEGLACCGTCTFTVSCCDIFGNAGGDWIGCLEGQLGTSGNICADPLFCGPGAPLHPHTLHANSPCAAENDPQCGQIGAWPVGCNRLLAVGPGCPYSTIQEAIDLADEGETVEIRAALLTGAGNRDVDFRGKNITVRSRSGDPYACVIDCLGTADDPHRGFLFVSGEGPTAVLEGVTIVNGHLGNDPNISSNGAGIYIQDDCSPTIRRCVIANCHAARAGGGIFCDHSEARFVECTVTGCTAIGYDNPFSGGGGAEMSYGAPTLIGCTFSDNACELGHGGGIHFWENQPVLENTIVAFSTTAEGILCSAGAEPTLTCCDVFGNAGGDWIGPIADQEGSNGNFSLDPRFCDRESRDYHLWNYSPCNQYGCGLIGAWPVGCWDPQGTDEPPAHVMSATRLFLSSGAPNPFTTTTRIEYELPPGAGGPPTLEVFDLSGRLVRRFLPSHSSAPSGAVVWDGADDQGRRLPGGIYLCRLSVRDERATRKLTFIR